MNKRKIKKSKAFSIGQKSPEISNIRVGWHCRTGLSHTLTDKVDKPSGKRPRVGFVSDGSIKRTKTFLTWEQVFGKIFYVLQRNKN